MKFGYCHLPCIACRLEPSDKSEMVTQLVFGEPYEILEETVKWTLVKTYFDHYECWIDNKLVRDLSERDYDFLTKSQYSICDKPFLPVTNTETEEKFFISYGSILPNFGNQSFIIGNQKFEIDGEVGFHTKQELPALLKQLPAIPYLWGGKTLFGFDCSGLVQIMYRTCGIWLPRDAYQQADEGEDVDFVQVAEAGDLAFFSNAEGRINHVGICTGDGYIIHASGTVRKDKLDQEGIYNLETKRYTHQLRIIKRVA